MNEKFTYLIANLDLFSPSIADAIIGIIIAIICVV